MLWIKLNILSSTVFILNSCAAKLKLCKNILSFRTKLRIDHSYGNQGNAFVWGLA